MISLSSAVSALPKNVLIPDAVSSSVMLRKNKASFSYQSPEVGRHNRRRHYTKDRWQIGAFFQGPQTEPEDQNLVGTTANAVQTQIWTALVWHIMFLWLFIEEAPPGRGAGSHPPR
jgi:hypothetical protein